MIFGRNYAIVFTMCMLFVFGAATTETVLIHGDVTVLGLFEVQRPVGGQCGEVVLDSVMTAEAVKWYIEAVNEVKAGALSVTVGFEGMKSCRVEGRAGVAAVSLADRVLHGTAGEVIVGLLGPADSSEAATVSQVLSSVGPDHRLLQLSYSGAAQLLANHAHYPNLYHVMPSDDNQLHLMVETMVSLEWNRIAVVYEDNIYDRERASGLKMRCEAAKICVAEMRETSVDESGEGKIDQLRSIMEDIIFGTTMDGTTTHPIDGVVVFASASISNSLLSVTKSIGVTGIPIFLLSEAAHLQKSVFEMNGKLLDTAKGSLLVSPTHRHISQFSDYWKSLFTNSIMFQREVLTNPWLQYVYDDIIGCGLSPCEFTPLTEAAVDDIFDQQPVSVSYALSAIHTIMKAVQVVYRELCAGEPVPCVGFSGKFTPAMMLEAMSGLHVNMADDFSFSLGSAVRIPEFSFDADGGLRVTADDTPTYQLFNLRASEMDAGSFVITKVGDYINGTLTLDMTLIRDYDSDGTERTWPAIRKAQCLPGKECTECIQNPLPDRYWHIPGDAYVVGIVPVYGNQGLGCGRTRRVNSYQVAESLVFALQTFKDSHGAYPSYFKRMNVGLIVLNSCNSAVVVKRKILNLNKYGLPLGSGELLDLTGKIIGYVGGVSSDISIAASQMLKPLKHVQISYSATTASLSDTEEHPYFMRLVNADSSQAHAMMLLVKELNGEYIQIIHTKGAYGESGKDQVVIQATAMGICVANTVMITESPTDDYIAYYEQLRKYPFAKLVIVFVQSWIARPFLYDLLGQMKQGDFQFIGSQAWGKQSLVLSDDVNQKLLGSFTVALEIAQEQRLVDHLRQMKPAPLSDNPWANTFLQTFLGCYLSESFDKQFSEECTDADSIRNDPDFKPDPWTSPSYDSLLALLIGAGSFFERVCEENATSLCSDFINDPTGIFEEIVSTVKLDIYGDGIPVKVFDELGDGTVGYNIYNIQRDVDDPQSLVYNNVGNYKGTLAISMKRVVYPVPDLYESRCPNEHACVECFGDDGATSDSSGTDNSGMIVLGALLAAAVVTIVILAIIICRKYRKDGEIHQTPQPHPGMERMETPGGHPAFHTDTEFVADDPESGEDIGVPLSDDSSDDDD